MSNCDKKIYVHTYLYENNLLVFYTLSAHIRTIVVIRSLTRPESLDVYKFCALQYHDLHEKSIAANSLVRAMLRVKR